MNRLAKNLKLIRKERWRISQDKFGTLMNSTRSKINSYENGGVEPSIGFILRLQALTQLSVKELFYEELIEEQIPPYALEDGQLFAAEPVPNGYKKPTLTYVIANQEKMMEQLEELSKRVQAVEKWLTKK